MTDQTPDPAYVPPPSEVLGPEALDQALLVLVARLDGTAFLSIANGVDQDSLAAWLHQTADLIAADDHREGCAECSAGLSHEHDTTG